MFTYEQFQNPPDEFRGTDFWMLNDQLSESEIRFQLAEMKKQGIASFIARTYVGLKSDYPGPDFKSKLRIIVDTAREYGLKLYLQAGYMPEAVMDLPPELTLKVITRQPSASTSDNIMAAHEDYVYSLTDTQLYVDMLNPEAIAFYLKQSYEDMWADFSGDFGRTIVSIWVDEPSYSSSGLPWNSHLEETFKKRWGYEIRPEVLKLFVDLDNYASVRYHYWQIVRNLMRDAYFVQVREWCQNHNLLFSGHLMGEDSMEQQLRRAGAVMPFYP